MKGSILLWVSVALFAVVWLVVKCIVPNWSYESVRRCTAVGAVIYIYLSAAFVGFELTEEPVFKYLSPGHLLYDLLKLINKIADKYLSTE